MTTLAYPVSLGSSDFRVMGTPPVTGGNIFSPGGTVPKFQNFPDLMAGTGGFVTDALLALIRPSISGTNVTIATWDEVSYVEPGQTPSKLVGAIRSAFGLSVTDLASVLGVERPTIYSWLRDQSRPNPARLERIGRVLHLADIWTTSRKDGATPLLDAKIRADLTLLDALRDPLVWEAEIESNLKAQSLITQPRSSRRRLVSMARQYGISERPPGDFDIATGRPLGPQE